MTFISSTEPGDETVTLTRQQIEDIIRWEMGWDDIDADAFWSTALKLQESAH